MWRYRKIWLASAALIAIGAAAAVVGSGGWPGQASDCLVANGCYCEAPRQGIVQQPANTWSSLALVLVGIGILGTVGRDRGDDRSDGATPVSRMATDPVYPTIYGVAVLGLGVGTMAFHASLTEWGGTADDLALIGFAAYPLAYGLTGGAVRSRSWFVRIYTATVASGAAVVSLVPNRGQEVFLTIAVLAALVESRAGRAAAPRPWPHLGVAAAFLGLGYGAWWLGRTDAATCDRSSVFQWHAVWHVLAAAAVLALFSYYMAQRSHAPDSTRLASRPMGTG